MSEKADKGVSGVEERLPLPQSPTLGLWVRLQSWRRLMGEGCR